MATSESDGSLREAIGCVVLLLFFVICIGGPSAAYRGLGPWAGLGASAGAFVVWVLLGPPPMPGLFPGLLMMAVLFNSAAWAIISIVRLIAG